nr:PREDICTED: cytochrome P450 2C31-like [Anolis carolinensis]|eukprot:XP_016852017.1 PREDICTED: cytochrome P450 2C31-like [Anolis carolinensis]
MDLRQLSGKYGSVFMVYFGLDQIVVVYGYNVVKKVLVDSGDDFLNRGRFPILDKINRGIGLFTSNGERWVQLRRFSLMTLKNFGMGKKSIEERIQEEAQHLVKALRETKGQPLSPTNIFNCGTGNVISHILLGERFNYKDEAYLRILHFITHGFRIECSFAGKVKRRIMMTTLGRRKQMKPKDSYELGNGAHCLILFLFPLQLYNIFPWIMDHLPGPHQNMFKEAFSVQDFVTQKIEEHVRTFDATNAPQDFIEAFLLKMEKEKINPKTEFTTENLMMSIYDLFVAGMETTSTTLRFTLMLLLEHSAVAAKVHKEIDSVIGQESPPAMADRSRMPYTEAVIHEAQRVLDHIPSGLVRKAKRDVELEGFIIPKGATILPMLTSALNDPEQFENPHRFDPEHFLDEKGNFKKNGADLPFSAGKRNCLGEGLARMELFLFVTTILQNFRLKYAPGVTKIDLTPDVSGFANIPRQVPFCFSSR